MKKFLLILLVTLTGSSLKAQEVALSADFTKGTCNFIVADVQKPVAGTSVWSQSKDYGMVASGFVSGKNYDSESWLISPTIDLQGLSHSRMSINHAVNFFSNIGKAKEETEICVRTVGGEWTKITGLCYPDRMSWNFTECTDIDLSAFDGQYIQIGLHYVSTSTKAGTWEIKKLEVVAERSIIVLNTLADLATVEEGSAVAIDFSESNAGKVDYSGKLIGSRPTAVSVGYTEAYLHDGHGYVMLHDFLPQDPGWHTSSGAALIGKIEGRYVTRNGMPGIEPTSFSSADNVLCLDDMFDPHPENLSVADALNPENRARYAVLDNVRIVENDNLHYASEGDALLLLDLRYDDTSADPDMFDDAHTFKLTGVIGAYEDEFDRISVPVFHLLETEAVATAISSVIDGRLTPSDHDGIYDLQGRKIIVLRGESLKPGVYIKNGHKFVIK